MLLKPFVGWFSLMCSLAMLFASAVSAQLPDKTASLQEELKQRYAAQLDIRFDQPYAGTDNPRQMLDIYRPKKSKSDKPLPAILCVHGGGWSGGSRLSNSNLAANTALEGRYVAIAVGYRLSGEAQWPAQLYDCKAAVRWVRAHAKELNIDAEYIGCMGGSAGGHLVSMLGLTNDRPELAGDVGDHTQQSSRVQCVVNFCGPSDLTIPFVSETAKEGYEESLIVTLIGGPLAKKRDVARSASPLEYVTGQAPPMLIIHGTHDTTVSYSHSEKLHRALKKAGVQSWLLPLANVGHNIPRPSAMVQRINTFFDRFLLGLDGEISVEPIVTPLPRGPVK